MCTYFRALATALEVIPRTLAQNCGANTIRTLTTLRAKHAEGNNSTFGVNGLSGKIEDMKALGIYEPLAVKLQTYKTAVETAILLLRIGMSRLSNNRFREIFWAELKISGYT